MSRASLGIAVGVIAVFVVFILAISGPVSAKSKGGNSDAGTACTNKFGSCSNRCGGHSTVYALDQAYKSCVDKCEAAFLGCMKRTGIDSGTTGGGHLPVNVGVNRGSGVTKYDKSDAGKPFTTTSPSGLNTTKEKDWATTSGSSSSNQSQHHGRHR